ncbi:LacI family DNA-binding transcriptional regulator [Amycolatopsis sp. H6(2020)]|uniref:LacI family transcriptional regulator n=1 Tax=Amycolatopsis vastitatis TaxID=1905142 RepID=A0A229SLR0_9PSEU|nr:LacI family DNA-binding transcriptional regulator [Amycolatopsis vastitatis]MBE8519301.1 LacI family DNA-binding transcriptional regulator [Amycolatopsis sp. H6(2020)]OXM59776.1 LacI family transcriptional regulator [Amycolatopsis vastitatis]
MTEQGPGSSPTLRDVATEAGVSAATASRALNGSTRNVSAEKLALVLRAAEKLGYAPNLSAQATARGSTKTVALIVHDIADPYFSSIAAGAIEGAEAAGLTVTMAVTDRSPDRELEIVSTLRGHRPHAIILAGSRIGDEQDALVGELRAYEAAGGRVAVVSQPGLPYGTVTVDNRRGAEELATALVAYGYRRFAVLRGPDALRTSRDRAEGFVASLSRAGIEVAGRFVVKTDFTEDGGHAAMTGLLDRGLDGVELVFAVNDVMAIGAMRALRDAGLVPGRDLAVAGFDDISAATDVDPALTTVGVPMRAMGLRAIDLALSGRDRSEVVWLPTTVVLRTSTPRRRGEP